MKIAKRKRSISGKFHRINGVSRKCPPRLPSLKNHWKHAFGSKSFLKKHLLWIIYLKVNKTEKPFSLQGCTILTTASKCLTTTWQLRWIGDKNENHVCRSGLPVQRSLKNCWKQASAWYNAVHREELWIFFCFAFASGLSSCHHINVYNSRLYKATFFWETKCWKNHTAAQFEKNMSMNSAECCF